MSKRRVRGGELVFKDIEEPQSQRAWERDRTLKTAHTRHTGQGWRRRSVDLPLPALAAARLQVVDIKRGEPGGQEDSKS